MKFIIIFLLFVQYIFSYNCSNRVFNIHITKPIKLEYLLTDIVNKCHMNVIIKNGDLNLLNKKIALINLKNVKLNHLLNVVFDNANLFYKLQGSKIIISKYKTETFRVDFIPNTITGSSNVNSIDNSMTTNYSFDFWTNLEKNLVQILKNINKDYKKPIIDKNSGFITVTGTREQIEEIRKYINDLNKRLHKEVLIDVKIYSVTLGESHQTGINWSQFNLLLNSRNKLRAKYIFGSQSIFDSTKFNLTGILNFLAQNGNVNSISNPKIATLNNQKAIISVGDTIYYKYASAVSNQSVNPITKYTIESKFVGVLLDITPQISDNNEIVLSINPRISAFKDPTQLNSLNRDMPPDTQDNTMMSVVRLKNNETLVLGGLITTDSSLRVNGVPVLKEIPVIKYFFSSKDKVTNKKELVFIITPKIIDFSKKAKLDDYGYKKLPTLEELNVREFN